MNQTIKTCPCGRSYTAHTWKLLRKVGRQRDSVNELELRQCPCENTIAIVVRDFRSYGDRRGKRARTTMRLLGERP